MQVAEVRKDGQRDVLEMRDGNWMEPLSPLSEEAYSVVRGVIPARGGVPLHSHTDAESFYVLSGEVEGLVQTTDGLEWQKLGPGDFIHIPAGVKHAWRNRSSGPVQVLMTCTLRLRHALHEMAENSKLPSGAGMQGLLEVAKRYGYWFGSPEENAAVGIALG